MRESTGKAIDRDFFYRGCLPEWLAPDAIVSAYYLLLLGHPARELEFLDAVNVQRNHVWSVEQSLPIYDLQRNDDLGVSLYYGELTDFLRRLFLRENRFQVLRLDVEGGYRTKIDPAMSPLLLFAWRNEATVIATYSSIGRDEWTLYEGALSLALFLSIEEEITLEFLSDMSTRYAVSGYTDPMAMVLRDFFWLRSIMEHVLVTGRMVGVTPLEAVPGLFCQEEIIWRELRKLRLMPLRLGQIRKIARANVCDVPSCLGLEITDLANLVYRAQWPWSQRCYYKKVARVVQPLGLREWLTSAMRVWLRDPLRYVDQAGHEHQVWGGNIRKVTDTTPVLVPPKRSRHTNLYSRFSPRQIELEPSTRQWQDTVRALAERLALEKLRAQTETQTEITAGEGVVEISAKKPLKKGPVQFMRDGKLTQEGRAVIRTMAEGGWGTDEILDKVPRTVPRQSVIAQVAVAHRAAK